jgi:MFS superfamily sulfate permease-like transporter
MNSPVVRPSFAADTVAGLSIAGLVLPEAVAYSGIANLPPQAGIIALVAGLACYGLIGTSRFAIVSATSSSAAVLGAACASLAGGNARLQLMLASALVLITGIYFLAAGLARLGGISDFISKPVLRGFTFGLALVIALRQVALMAGVHPASSYTPLYAIELLQELPHWNQTGVLVGVASLALLFALSRFRRLPGGLLVIALGIGASHWLQLAQRGVSLVGPIHLALSTPDMPVLARDQWLRLLELGFAMVLVLYSESYGSIRSMAIKHNDPVAPDRDLFALGASNVLSALFAGMPVGAGYSATAANEAAGAESRRAGGIALAVLIIILLLVLSYVELTPEPVLAAIVIYGVSHSLRLAVFRPFFIWRRDRLVVICSLLAVLWLGILDGLLAGVAISLIMLLRRFSQASVAELGRLGGGHDFVKIADHPQAERVAGLLILRPEEPLFFANVERILSDARRLIKAAEPTVGGVILNLEETFDLDSTSIDALLAFFADIGASGLRLVLARLKHPVHQLLDQIAGTAPPAPAPVFTGLSVDEAVRLARSDR